MTNGWLRISGDGLGYLGTVEEYSDYTLKLEYKWGATNTVWGDRIGKARDSGVFLHATGPDGNSFDGKGAFMAAIECNVFEGAVGDFLLIRGAYGDGTQIHPKVQVKVRPERDRDGWFWHSPEGDEREVERWGRVNWIRKDPAWRDVWQFRGQHDLEHAPGQWNRLECRCHGDTVEIRLNGVLVNRAERVWPGRGRILLQCEGSEIFFRRLVLEKR